MAVMTPVSAANDQAALRQAGSRSPMVMATQVAAASAPKTAV